LEWKFRRAVARVGVVDEVMAGHAAHWCGRAYRRTDVLPPCSMGEQPRVTWSIDVDVIALARHATPGEMVVTPTVNPSLTTPRRGYGHR
jgi:hypothetical protein